MEGLRGEECAVIAVGSSHCVACGRSGDCFVWGDNDAGQLGLGSFASFSSVAINHSFPPVATVSAGANHSVALTSNGSLYSWGHGLNGRLGNNAVHRIGVPDSEKSYFNIPYTISEIEPIRLVSCGADHTLAVGSSGVWAWGCGSGGKLGLGDTQDRWRPSLIPRTRAAIAVAAGTWHSLMVLCFPPMLHGGYVYSFGSGYHGQLALGDKQVATTPELVEYFASYHLLVKHISAGSHHCGAITTGRLRFITKSCVDYVYILDGELYTWGSNKYNCLGRTIDELDVEYTPAPGHCGGFGALVDGIGRGLVRQVSCGKEFTIVSTWPYDGPDLATAQLIIEEQNQSSGDNDSASFYSSSVFV